MENTTYNIIQYKPLPEYKVKALGTVKDLLLKYLHLKSSGQIRLMDLNNATYRYNISEGTLSINLEAEGVVHQHLATLVMTGDFPRIEYLLGSRLNHDVNGIPYNDAQRIKNSLSSLIKGVPLKEKGTGFLQVGSFVFSYYPNFLQVFSYEEVGKAVIYR